MKDNNSDYSKLVGLSFFFTVLNKMQVIHNFIKRMVKYRVLSKWMRKLHTVMELILLPPLPITRPQIAFGAVN